MPVHDRNQGAYRLAPLTNLDADPTSHHARGLTPCTSAEHHEQQEECRIRAMGWLSHMAVCILKFEFANCRVLLPGRRL